MGLALAAAVTAGYYVFQSQSAKTDINNFDDCAAAGYPIQESYPARCVTPDGQSFTQEQ